MWDMAPEPYPKTGRQLPAYCDLTGHPPRTIGSDLGPDKSEQSVPRASSQALARGMMVNIVSDVEDQQAENRQTPDQQQWQRRLSRLATANGLLLEGRCVIDARSTPQEVQTTLWSLIANPKRITPWTSKRSYLGSVKKTTQQIRPC